MSPARLARRKEKRLTIVGMLVETAYVMSLSAFCCLACVLLFFVLGQ
jgi:hypothetical protein